MQYKLTQRKIFLHRCKKAATLLLNHTRPLSLKKYILFSNGFDKYSGYPKELFEQFAQHPDYTNKIFWTYKTKPSPSPHIPPCKFVKKYSLKWFYILFHAKALFFSHDTTDITPICPPWTINFNLWHGRPIKKIGRDSKAEMSWIREKESKKIQIPFHFWTYVFAHDAAHIEIIKSSWGLPDSKILKFNPSPAARISKDQPILDSARILYAPTFRPYPYEDEFIKSPKTVAWLLQNNFTMLYKAHPSQGKAIATHHPCIIDITKSPAADALARSCQIIITDYSSIIFDAYSNQKIILLWLDYAKYNEAQGVYIQPSQINKDNIFYDIDSITNLDQERIHSLACNPFNFETLPPVTLETLHALLKN